jgi:hypothetical protein
MAKFGKSFSARRSRGQMGDGSQQVFGADTPQDVTSPRAKSMRHGKSTADKCSTS